jgi:DNA polymerase-3 subunit beta
MDGRLEASIETGGMMCIPAETLNKFLSNLPKSESVTLAVADGAVKASCGKARATLPLFPTDDWPSTSSNGEQASFRIPATELADLIRRTAFAANRLKASGILTGILLRLSPGSIEAVAADGSHLSTTRRAIQYDGEAYEAVAGARDLHRALTMLERGEAMVSLIGVPDVRQLSIRCGDLMLTTAAIDGKYPDVSRIVHTTSSRLVSFDRQEMLDAVGRAVKMSGGDYLGISEFIGQVNVFSRDQHSIDYCESVPTELAGPDNEFSPRTVLVDGKQFQDGLQSMKTDRCLMGTDGPTSPVRISSPDDDSHKYVIMPMDPRKHIL